MDTEDSGPSKIGCFVLVLISLVVSFVSASIYYSDRGQNFSMLGWAATFVACMVIFGVVWLGSAEQKKRNDLQDEANRAIIEREKRDVKDESEP